MSERAPYSRLYWCVMDDPKFDGIREDPKLFGSWSLLLIAADMAYPSSAYVLPTVSRAALSRLVAAGLVDLLDGRRYRIRGLEAERTRRRIAATNRGPSGTRTGPKRDPNGEQDEAEDETRRDEDKTRQAADDGREDLEAFLLINRRAPTPKQRKLLDELLERHDLTGPAWAADIMLSHPDDPIGAVIAEDKKWRDERIAEARTSERPKPQPRRPRSLPTPAKELLAHWMAQNDIEASKS